MTNSLELGIAVTFKDIKMVTVGSFQMECIKVNGKPVSQLKVEELKTELELRGLKKSGVKKELQDRLCEYLEKGGNNTEDSDIRSSPTVSISFSTQEAPSITQETSDQNNSQELEPEIQGKSKDQNEEDENEPNEQDQVKENHNKKGQNKEDQESKPTGLYSNKNKAELEDGEIAVQDEDKKDSQKRHLETQPEKKRRISLTRQTSKTAHTPGSRKRKWSSTVNKNKSSVVISTDSLKGLIPGVQLASTPALEAVMDFDDDKEDEEMVAEKQEEEEEEKENEPAEDNISDSKEEEKTPIDKKTRIVHVEESKKLKLNQSVEAESNETDVNPNVVQEISNQDMPTGEVNRDEDLPSSSTASSETNFKANRAVSPPRNQPSQVIHVAHLVRPFTQNQLNQLLTQFGSLVEGGFWINKIKSHCYVTYSSVDDAKIARDSLHGQRWPNTSPRILNVDFGDDEQMLEDTDGVLGKKKEVTDKIEEENEKEKKKEKGKETRRHKERKESKPKQEPSPANLLDKLFRKTTTVPFIYWLPLTKEQILIKENERDERRKQRQLALQEEEKQGNERLGREKELDWGREKPRDTEREKERETSRPKERKPLRDNRALSPPSRPPSDRRSAEFKNRSRSRSKGLSTRRDDPRRR